jgi:outer membrane protein assembly factor BamB
VWHGRVLFRGLPLTIVDGHTGNVEDTIDLPPVAGFGGFLVDELLLDATPDRTRLSAFDLVARELRWQASLTGAFSEAGVTIDADQTFTVRSDTGDPIVGYASRALFGVSPADGTVRWVRPAWLSSVVPIVADGLVYASLWNPMRLLALDQQTGTTVFDLPLDERIPGFELPHVDVMLTVAGEHLIATRRNGAMVLFRRADGELVSTYQYRDELALPIVTSRYILVPAGDGCLLVFDRP